MSTLAQRIDFIIKSNGISAAEIDKWIFFDFFSLKVLYKLVKLFYDKVIAKEEALR